MSESVEGVRVAATRQNAGRPLILAVFPGGVNSPVVTGCAAMIFVFGSASRARLSHVFGTATALLAAKLKIDRAIKSGKIGLRVWRVLVRILRILFIALSALEV